MTHRVVVIPFGFGLGDTVNMRPMLEAIVRARPDSSISVLCPASYQSLVPLQVETIHAIRGVPLWQRAARDSLTSRVLQHVSARTAAPALRRLPIERWSRTLSKLLTAQGFDEVLNLVEIVCRLDLDNRWTPGPWNPDGGHLIDVLAEYLQSRGIDLPPDRRKPALPDSSNGDRASRTIVLNPNAGSTLKEAPMAFWTGVGRSLVEQGHAPLVLRGTGAGMSEEVCRRVLGTRLVSTPGIPNLTRLISSARLVIGPDSGVLHLAAALGVSYLGLFGSTEPHFLGPYGASADDYVLSPANHAEVCRGCWTAQVLPRAACAMKYEPNCLSHLGPQDALPHIYAKLAARSGRLDDGGTDTGVIYTEAV